MYAFIVRRPALRHAQRDRPPRPRRAKRRHRRLHPIAEHESRPQTGFATDSRAAQNGCGRGPSQVLCHTAVPGQVTVEHTSALTSRGVITSISPAHTGRLNFPACIVPAFWWQHNSASGAVTICLSRATAPHTRPDWRRAGRNCWSRCGRSYARPTWESRADPGRNRPAPEDVRYSRESRCHA